MGRNVACTEPNSRISRTERSYWTSDIPWLVVGSKLLRWTPAGYSERRSRTPSENVTLITPPSLVEVLRVGWEPVVPLFHPSAR